MKRALVVDDLPEKGMDIKDELLKQNFEIIHFARCYIDAIKLLEEKEYDLIILDMTLPREITKGSKLITSSGKKILYDMFNMRKCIPSIVITRYTYFGDEAEPAYLHTSNFCLENPYFMKNKEELIEAKYDLSTYMGLHELFSQKISFYVGMIYYNPHEDTWKDNLRDFIQKIKENKNEYTDNGRCGGKESSY